MNRDLEHKSKFLSLVLRHQPEKANIKLDKQGWAFVADILSNCHLTMQELKEVVETNNKQRFKFSEDRMKIRANQGHSINVNLNFKPIPPPDILFHGTASRFVNSISKQGLMKMNRQHVHLSADIATAENVGRRHGKPVIFAVDAKRMNRDGYEFYLSDNNVWLTNCVPIQYMRVEK